MRTGSDAGGDALKAAMKPTFRYAAAAAATASDCVLSKWVMMSQIGWPADRVVTERCQYDALEIRIRWNDL